jgi:hypothetical protein
MNEAKEPRSIQELNTGLRRNDRFTRAIVASAAVLGAGLTLACIYAGVKTDSADDRIALGAITVMGDYVVAFAGGVGSVFSAAKADQYADEARRRNLAINKGPLSRSIQIPNA